MTSVNWMIPGFSAISPVARSKPFNAFHATWQLSIAPLPDGHLVLNLAILSVAQPPSHRVVRYRVTFHFPAGKRLVLSIGPESISHNQKSRAQAGATIFSTVEEFSGNTNGLRAILEMLEVAEQGELPEEWVLVDDDEYDDEGAGESIIADDPEIWKRMVAMEINEELIESFTDMRLRTVTIAKPLGVAKWAQHNYCIISKAVDRGDIEVVASCEQLPLHTRFEKQLASRCINPQLKRVSVTLLEPRRSNHHIICIFGIIIASLAIYYFLAT